MNTKLWGVCALVLVLSPISACDKTADPAAKGDAVTALKDTVTADSGAVDGSAAADAPSDGVEASDGDATQDTQAANPPECPPDDPAGKTSVACSTPGLECVYRAVGCPAGAKPDNRWTCTFQGFLIPTQPFHHCSIVGNSPPHRPDASACEPAPAAPVPCATSRPSSYESTCSTAAECGAGQVCLDSVKFGDKSTCECFDAGCTADADCAAGEACVCGKVATDGVSPCGSWTGKPCGNRCVPAGCRVDTDCVEGAVCSPSRDLCGWQVESFRCHDPAVDACLSDLECESYEQCRFTAEEGWHCEGPPTCD